MSQTAQVRIIAGKWRGRKVKFFTSSGIRPTPNSVRETLFNWLAPVIDGAKCLDLFAGSGALGLEALSRGASQVVFVDRDAKAVGKLKENARGFGATQEEASAYCNQAHVAIRQLATRQVVFDIVFLDPPFYKNNAVCYARQINDSGCLTSGGLVYIEVERSADLAGMPAGWECLHDDKRGHVRYLLYENKNPL